MNGRWKGIRLYPTSLRDRQVVWASFGLGLLSLFVLVTADESAGYILAASSGLVAALGFVLAYAFQDRPEHAESARYAHMVGQINDTKKVLESLSTFLETERSRVNQAQQTVSRLQDEEAALAPVVKADRAIVEAVLSAHASAVRAHAWKDRLLGFGLGVLSSLVAGAILYAFGAGQ